MESGAGKIVRRCMDRVMFARVNRITVSFQRYLNCTVFSTAVFLALYPYDYSDFYRLSSLNAPGTAMRRSDLGVC
jgi:hypothetical protein